MPCDLTVAWIEVICLLKIGGRRAPVVLGLLNLGQDCHGFGVIRQLAASDVQFVTRPGVIRRRVETEHGSKKVIASQLYMSLGQVRS